MNSIKMFFKILNESRQTVLQNFPVYLKSYLAFFFIGLLASIPWEGMGYPSESFFEVVSAIIIGLLSLVVIVNVILIEKSKAKHREKEQILYAAPTYLIYTLYSSLVILIGPMIMLGVGPFFPLNEYGRIALAIIPGVIVAVFVGMVPIASVLIDNDSVNYFKISFKMAKQNPLLIFCFGAAAILIDAPSLAFDLIPDWKVVLAFNLLYSIFDAFLTVVVTVASVHIFYHLKRQLNDPS